MTADASLVSAVFGRGGSVADKGPCPRSGGGATRSYSFLCLTGPERGRERRCTPAVMKADVKREVGANDEKVK